MSRCPRLNRQQLHAGVEVLIIGDDGYPGSPQAMYLTSRRYKVGVIDRLRFRRVGPGMRDRQAGPTTGCASPVGEDERESRKRAICMTSVDVQVPTAYTDPALQDHWLRIGAKQKATSVVQLTRGMNVQDVLEVGCGTGAILEELSARGYAARYWACEPSNALFMQLQGKSIPRLVAAECSPLYAAIFDGRRFDLIILSHVLEHLLDPSGLLSACLDRASFVVMEIPIEANTLGNLRAFVKRLLTGKHRTQNPAGHIQFFSVRDAHKFVRWAGAEIVRTRLYYPREASEFQARWGSFSRQLCQRILLFAETLVGDRLWASLYYGHYALLLRRRQIGDVGRWEHELYAPPGSDEAVVSGRSC